VSDKYDDAIEWLVAHADDPVPRDYEDYYDMFIEFVWSMASCWSAECLFAYCTPNASVTTTPSGQMCGCLTQIRRGDALAWTTELTAAIRDDDNIPASIESLSGLRGDELRAALQPFAFWQRRLDREIRQPALATEGSK
jgi:hypothetical protein